MLTKPDLQGLPTPFMSYMGRAVSNILTGHFYDVTVDATSISANTTSEQTFTVKGLRTTDLVLVNKPSHDAGLAIGACRASATDTLAITYVNATGSAINPSSETYLVVAIRREKE